MIYALVLLPFVVYELYRKPKHLRFSEIFRDRIKLNGSIVLLILSTLPILAWPVSDVMSRIVWNVVICHGVGLLFYTWLVMYPLFFILGFVGYWIIYKNTRSYQRALIALLIQWLVIVVWFLVAFIVGV